MCDRAGLFDVEERLKPEGSVGDGLGRSSAIADAGLFRLALFRARADRRAAVPRSLPSAFPSTLQNSRCPRRSCRNAIRAQVCEPDQRLKASQSQAELPKTSTATAVEM